MSFCTIHFSILKRIIQQEGLNLESMTFVLFGATGDLAKRKIYPALYNLYRDQKLPKQISVIGLGRRQVSHEDFQERIKESIETFSRQREEGTPELEGF